MVKETVFTGTTLTAKLQQTIHLMSHNLSHLSFKDYFTAPDKMRKTTQLFKYHCNVWIKWKNVYSY